VFLGRDFNPNNVLPVQAQVDKLILQATSLENLCQCFSGWYDPYYNLSFLYLPQLLGARSGKRRISIGDYRDTTSLSLSP
jgi:hypothetical protein